MFPLIVSYYTKNTGYEKEAENLIASCKEHSLPCQIDPIDSLGSWEKNCCYKPRYLLEKLKNIGKPLLWLDVDASIAQKPTLFETIECDIALRIVEELPQSHPSKMISGTIYINSTPATFKILELWEMECCRMFKKEEGEVWDQIALRNVLQNLPFSATIFPLPKEYYLVYDRIKNEEEKKRGIIIHYQASRLLKKEVNQEVAPFWHSSFSSGIEMKQSREIFNDINNSP